MTLEEEMKELSDKMRKEHARCSHYCSLWNSEDRDCEVYGWQRSVPSRCRLFLEKEVRNGRRRHGIQQGLD